MPLKTKGLIPATLSLDTRHNPAYHIPMTEETIKAYAQLLIQKDKNILEEATAEVMISGVLKMLLEAELRLHPGQIKKIYLALIEKGFEIAFSKKFKRQFRQKAS